MNILSNILTGVIAICITGIVFHFWAIWSLKRFDKRIFSASQEVQHKLNEKIKSTGKKFFPEIMMQELFLQEMKKYYRNKSMLKEAEKRAKLWLTYTLQCELAGEIINYQYFFLKLEANINWLDKQLFDQYVHAFWEEIIESTSPELLKQIIGNPKLQSLPEDLLKTIKSN